MTFLVHTAIGSVIGEVVPIPALAFATAAASHIIVDKLPHFWPENLWPQLKYQAVDVVATLALIYYVFSVTHNPVAVGWGILGSLSVDLILVAPYIKHTKAGVWHFVRQPHKTAYAYLVTDIALAAAFIVLFYFVK
jgi:hypothetical protein